MSTMRKPAIPRYPTPNSPATPLNMVRASVLNDESVNTKKMSPVSDGSKADTAHVQAAFSSKNIRPAPSNSGIQKNDGVTFQVLRAMKLAAAKIQAIDPQHGPTTRPCIKLGMNKTAKDIVAISQIPRTMGEDALMKLISSFGSVETFNWNKIDPTVCQVVYEQSGVARGAVRFLRRTASYLDVQLRTHNSSVQLFVGDLLPSITEKMLEVTFSRIVGSKVTAALKRDPKSRSPVGYGFLTFKSENDAIKALIEGNRMKIGDATIRIGRAERNCYLYIDNVPEENTIEELKGKFAEFGELVDEDCEHIRRADATVKVENASVAMFSKMILEKTCLTAGNVTVSYGHQENHRHRMPEVRLAVMFKRSVAKPPSALKDLILTTFSKYGHCAVKIPLTRYGKWKHHAIVTFLGEYKAARLAAITAMQNVHHVSQVGVHINWAREILPRIPSNVPARTAYIHGHAPRNGNRIDNGHTHREKNKMDATFRARMLAKEFVPRKMEFKTPSKESGDEHQPTNDDEVIHVEVARAVAEGSVADTSNFIHSPVEDGMVSYYTSVSPPAPLPPFIYAVHVHGDAPPLADMAQMTCNHAATRTDAN